MNKSLIQIIIPIYNVEEYVRECVESVLSQTYENKEIILVNDGQTDNQMLKIQDLIDCNDNIKVINQSNKGLQAARNAGISMASGEYITFIDSDDFYDIRAGADWIQKAIEILDNHKDCQICQCGFQFLYSEGTLKQYKIKNEDYKIDGNAVLNDNIYKDISFVVVWNKVYRRSLFDSTRFTEGINFEDECIIHRLLINNRIYVINKPYIVYRQRSNSITGSKKINRHTFDWIYAIEDRQKILKNAGFSVDYIAKCYVYGFKKLRDIKMLNSREHNKDIVEKIYQLQNKFKRDVQIKDILKIQQLQLFVKQLILRVFPVLAINIWILYIKLKKQQLKYNKNTVEN